MSENDQSDHPVRRMIRRVRAVQAQVPPVSQKGSDPLEASRFSNPITRLAGEGQTPFGIPSEPSVEESNVDPATIQQTGATPGSTQHSPLPSLASWLASSAELGEVSAIRPDLPNRIGRFEIKRVLGAGGFGWVLLADDPQLNRPIALKVPRLDALVSPTGRARFLREARAAALLAHPNIVSVYEAGQIGPVLYIAFELVQGQSLTHWLHEHREELSDANIARLLETLAHAVQHAHQRGIIHRDLKPANVLIQQAESTGCVDSSSLADRAKITDFGLAFLSDPDGDLTRSGALVGTPKYLAPEQIESRGVQSEPTIDVYGLGAVLYEVLTGQPPFTGATLASIVRAVEQDSPVPPRRLNPRVSKDLEAICLKCLEKQPEARYESAAALAEDLTRFLEGIPVRARRPGPFERAWRWTQRNLAVASAFALAIVSLTIGLSVSIYLARQATTSLVESQQQRERAERHRDRADVVVDNLLNEVADSLEAIPQMQPLRRRLLEMALKHERAVMADEGTDAESQFRVAESLGRVADLLFRLGQFAAAKEAAQEIEAILGQMPPDANTEQQDRQAILLVKAQVLRSRVYLQQGEHALAADHLQAILSNFASEPAPPLARLQASATYVLGIARRESGDNVAAEAAFFDSMSILQKIPLAQKIAADDCDIVSALSMIGGLRYSTGQYDQAIEIWREVADREFDIDPNIPQQNVLRGNRAAGLVNLGTVYASKRDFELALDYCQQSAEQYQQLCQEFPLHFGHAQGRLSAMLGQASALQNAGHATRALDKYQEAIAWGEQLIHRFGEQPRLLMDLGRALGNLGNVLQYLNREAEANDAWARSLDLARKRVELQPTQANSHSDLIFSLNNYVTYNLQKNRLAEAAALIDEASALAEQALLVAPSDQAILTSIRTFYANQTLLHCFRQNHEQALAEIDNIVGLQPDKPNHLVFAAKTAARCQLSVLGNLHDLFGTPDDEEIAERYAEKSLALLSTAKDLGFRDFAWLRRQPEFSGLFTRPEFIERFDAQGDTER